MGQTQVSDKAELEVGWQDVPGTLLTKRLRVPGGWLYMVWPVRQDPAVCFVPDPLHVPTLPTPHDAGWDSSWSGVPGDGT